LSKIAGGGEAASLEAIMGGGVRYEERYVPAKSGSAILVVFLTITDIILRNMMVWSAVLQPRTSERRLNNVETIG